MWRNRHICTKFQENRHIFGSTKKNFFETWQHHIEPGMWRFVTKIWHDIFSSPSLRVVPSRISNLERKRGQIMDLSEPNESET